MYGRSQWMKPPYQATRGTIGHAVSEEMIRNETLGCFIRQTSELVRKIGVEMEFVCVWENLDHIIAHYG